MACFRQKDNGYAAEMYLLYSLPFILLHNDVMWNDHAKNITLLCEGEYICSNFFNSGVKSLCVHAQALLCKKDVCEWR